VANRTPITDPGVMRALAHPVRLDLLEHLSSHPDGATATECARVVGLSPSATSYHLRAMAKVGLIHEGTSRGDGRERVWQSASVGGFELQSEEVTPEQVALIEASLARGNEKIRRYLERAAREPSTWSDEMSRLSDIAVHVTREELQALLDGIDALIEPYRRTQRPDPPDTSRGFAIQLRVIPSD
jgi:DNA-binding transcriptional ArsR family regulator